MVMLCITADGNKLSFHIILNRKMTTKSELYPKGVSACTKRNEWVTAELIEDLV
jgi:hypothetical protein